MFTRLSVITMPSTENIFNESFTVKQLRGWSIESLNTTWNSIVYGDCENVLNFTKATNREHDLLTPTIFVGFLAVLGFFGNILVLIVFRVKYKPTVYRTIILTLAVYDALLCGISLPFEVYDIHNEFTFQADEWVCTLIRTLNHVFVFNSGYTVLLMTIDRFRRVCRPLKVQMTLSVARGSIFVIFIFSILLSIPNLFIRGIYNVQIHGNITGRDCTISEKYIDTKIPTIYFVVLLLLCLTNISILVVLYIWIGHDIIVHIRYQKSFKLDRNNISERSNSTEISVNNTSERSYSTEVSVNTISLSVPHTKIDNSVILPDTNLKGKPLKLTETLTQTESERKFVKMEMAMPRTRGSYNINNVIEHGLKLASTKIDAHGLKITKIAVTISIFYILSYIPTLIENILEGVYGEEVLSLYVSSLLLDILKRTFAINHVINPIIYGFIDEKFRTDCKAVFLICLKRCKC